MMTPGTFVIVRYGRDGEQLARYESLRGGSFAVKKWLSNGRRWTGTIVVGQILRVATDKDLRKYRHAVESLQPALF